MLYLIILTSIVYQILGEPITTNQGLIAYDCTDETVNITSFSLIDVEPCEYEWDNITTEQTHIQVVQTKRIFDVQIYQCKVIFKRRITYCGMHSHLAAYQGSYKYIVKEFDPTECRRVHETGTLKVYNEIHIHELTRNNTSNGEVLIAGEIQYSSCQGHNYFDGITHFRNALVTMEYEITLMDYMAKLDTTDGTIQFKGGLICKFEHGFCLDSIDGYMTWDTRIDQECATGQYSVIYEGMANKTYNFNEKKGSINALFSAISNEQLFSIKVKKHHPICGYPGYESDHAQIYILETPRGSRIIKNLETNERELDLVTYFNSKITTVEHHLSTQLSLLYRKLVNELCKVEKSLLETRLISARINPQEFASNLMKSPGYTAVIAGEIIYIIQCKPAYVTLIPSLRCYQEIPVTKNNLTMFMSSVTHILQRHGTQIECTPLLPAKFRFGTQWYQIDGNVHRVLPPNKLSTEIKSSWKYDYLPNLMAVGIYDQKNVKKMHDMIYENEDRRSSSVVLHRTISGFTTDHQGFDFSHLINENVIETTITKYWDKFLSLTTFVGQFTSSIVGFWLIGKAFKFTIDSIVHGRILYDIYGISWKLIASFWDSLTTLLTHKHHSKRRRHIFESSTLEQEMEETRAHIFQHTCPCLIQHDTTIQSNTPEHRITNVTQQGRD